MRKTCIVAFDLDNTLASIGNPIEERNLITLKRLERPEVLFAMFSGKPCSYLSGFLRQAGLSSWFIVGENGHMMQKGTSYPPLWNYSFRTTRQRELNKIRTGILHLLKNKVWFQPNERSLAVFFLDESARLVLREHLGALSQQNRNIVVYEHSDSFDITTGEVNKGTALNYLISLMELSRNDVIAVGDGENDIPLLKASGYSIIIGANENDNATTSVSCIEEALVIVERWLNN